MPFDVRRFRELLRTAKAQNQLTGCGFAVGHALLIFVNRTGICWPSQRTLAKEAGCDPKTVRTTLQQMRGLGLLSWVPQEGVWHQRAPNCYTLCSDVTLPPPEKKSRSKSSEGVMPAGSRPLSWAAQMAACPAPKSDAAALSAAREAHLAAKWMAERQARQARMVAGARVRV